MITWQIEPDLLRTPELEELLELATILESDIVRELQEYLKERERKEEETIPVTLGVIRAKCGWGRYCDITGANHYMLNEHTVNDREIFDVRVSHAKQLGLI